MSYGKKDVLEILVKRDGMSKDDAQELVDQCQEEINCLLHSLDSPFEQLINAEELIQDYFGLEPDYLLDFIE